MIKKFFCFVAILLVCTPFNLKATMPEEAAVPAVNPSAHDQGDEDEEIDECEQGCFSQLISFFWSDGSSLDNNIFEQFSRFLIDVEHPGLEYE